ncbi:non-homologous end-joining DNA ligase [Nocardioides aurantiacus]|uniref:non-homologous end-joining DNA ligase n=1 Tax=Nocardioides aurantiacus TaxID=86796 RepID=UPI00403EFC23
MLATRGDHVPPGDGWAHEVKWDGMRVLVEVRRSGVRVRSRNENDVTVSFPELQGLAAAGLPDLVLDGEVVALGQGVPSFGALADRMHVRDAARAQRLARSNPVTLIVFDLLALDGTELLDRPLSERRARLEELGLDDASWQVPPTYADGQLLLDAAGQQGLEGIVSKRLASRYHPGRRSRDWLKFPMRPTASYVVGGFRWETGSEHRLGAVLVGEPTADGLLFRGRVGSGIAGRAGVALAELLAPLHATASPFSAELPRLDRQGTVWVEPRVVVDVQYLTFTTDGRLRQPAYRGVRTDLGPDDLPGA